MDESSSRAPEMYERTVRSARTGPRDAGHPPGAAGPRSDPVFARVRTCAFSGSPGVLRISRAFCGSPRARRSGPVAATRPRCGHARRGSRPVGCDYGQVRPHPTEPGITPRSPVSRDALVQEVAVRELLSAPPRLTSVRGGPAVPLERRDGAPRDRRPDRVAGPEREQEPQALGVRDEHRRGGRGVLAPGTGGRERSDEPDLLGRPGDLGEVADRGRADRAGRAGGVAVATADRCRPSPILGRNQCIVGASSDAGTSRAGVSTVDAGAGGARRGLRRDGRPSGSGKVDVQAPTAGVPRACLPSPDGVTGRNRTRA